MPTYDQEIASIRAVYREMRFMQMQRTRLDGAFQAYVRMLCGYSTHAPDPEALTRAQGLIAGTLEDPMRYAVEDVRTSNDAAAKVFIDVEKKREKRLEKIVAALPVWTEWGAGIRGLGPKGLGCLIGEAGDIGAYRSEAALWKRMGVGVIDGTAQGKLGRGASAEDWIKHGYNKKRRSVLFQIGDPLVRQGEKFRQIYLWRKEIERNRAALRGLTVKPSAKIRAGERATCISDGHIDRRARRYMEKKLLRSVYRAWRRTMVAGSDMREAA